MITTNVLPEDEKLQDRLAQASQVVLLVHGIRTQGEWEDMVTEILETIPDTVVYPLKYEYFDAISFWLPFGLRQGPIRELRRRINVALRINKKAKISVIAHSYGTYAIAEILEEDPNLELERLVLCGSILPRKFRWDDRLKQVSTEVINDCGIRDIWPVMAQSLSWGYGASGTFGFGYPKVRDRFHDFDHGGFLERRFVEDFWLPWFRNNDYIRGTLPRTRPYWWSLLTVFQLKWLFVSLILILGAWQAKRAWSRDPHAPHVGTNHTVTEKPQEVVVHLVIEGPNFEIGGVKIDPAKVANVSVLAGTASPSIPGTPPAPHEETAGSKSPDRKPRVRPATRPNQDGVGKSPDVLISPVPVKKPLFPFIALVRAHFPNDKPQSFVIGTGTLITRRVILTTGNIVYDPSRGGYAEWVDVSFASEGDRITIKADVLRTTKEWVDIDSVSMDPTSAFNIGCIALSAPVDIVLPVSVAPMRGSEASLLFSIVGYSAGAPGPGAPGDLYGCQTHLSRIGDYQLSYPVQTLDGMSGAPVYIIDDAGRPMVRGVHTSIVNGLGRAISIYGPIADLVSYWVAEFSM